MAKVEALLSVLEVAALKVRRNLEIPGADFSRLERVLRNLETTILVCRRAQRQLRDGPFDRPLPQPRPGSVARMNRREYVETGSLEEFRRFREAGPIRDDELQQVDIDRLCTELSFWRNR
ncbi:MAG TPA: hypothetical protein VGC54_04585 [Planctomycetota bacterium]